MINGAGGQVRPNKNIWTWRGKTDATKSDENKTLTCKFACLGDESTGLGIQVSAVWEETNRCHQTGNPLTASSRHTFNWTLDSRANKQMKADLGKKVFDRKRKLKMAGPVAFRFWGSRLVGFRFISPISEPMPSWTSDSPCHLAVHVSV